MIDIFPALVKCCCCCNRLDVYRNVHWLTDNCALFFSIVRRTMKLLSISTVCSQLLISVLLRSLQHVTGLSLALRHSGNDVTEMLPLDTTTDVETFDAAYDATAAAEATLTASSTAAAAAATSVSTAETASITFKRQRAIKRLRRSLVPAANHCTTLCTMCRQRMALRFGVPCQRECENLSDGVDTTPGHHYRFCLLHVSGQRSEFDLRSLVPSDGFDTWAHLMAYSINNGLTWLHLCGFIWWFSKAFLTEICHRIFIPVFNCCGI